MSTVNNNPSIISRVISSVIMPVVVGGYGINFYKKEPKTSIDYWMAGGILIIAIILIANQKYLDQKYGGLLLWFKKRDAVYKSIKIRLEYLDAEGKKVAWKREDNIDTISIWRKKGIPPIPLEFDGKISRKQTTVVNGYYTFFSNSKLFFYCDNINVKHNGFSVYTTVAIDSFLNKSEYWNFNVKNVCKFCKLQVVIPNNRKFRSYRLLKMTALSSQSPLIDKNDNTDKSVEIWAEVRDARILKSHYWSKTSITAYVENLNVNEQYRIEWVLN